MLSISIGFWVASGIIVLLFVLLFGHIKEFLKDEAPANPVKPYSLGRSIMFYWTVIVVFSICYLGIVLNAMPAIDNDVLLLMGIVIGTSGTARVIDYVQTSQGIPRHQNLFRGDTFLLDIISDQNGLSIHRFQNVIFNVIYGAYFIASVFSTHAMPDFSDTVLALLGISSGTYALLKIPENSSSPNSVTGSAQLQLTGSSTTPAAPIVSPTTPVVYTPPATVSTDTAANTSTITTNASMGTPGTTTTAS